MSDWTPPFLEVAFNIPAKKNFCYRLPENSACGVGFRVRAPFRGRLLQGFVVGELSEPPQGSFEVKSLDRVIDEEPIFDNDLLELGRWVSGMYLCSLGEALSAMIPGARKESRIAPGEGEGELKSESIELTEYQSRSVQEIHSGESGLYYLFGVTGSGKTEVYLRVAEKILESGRSVIYLVPEIALTHQLIDVLQRRFGPKVGLIHSRLAPTQRLREWQRIRRGEAPLVVGARSAVFAPVKKLGLIILDEEHESSYKSGATPRYHARQVAMKRRALSEGVIIMGSATPSAEAFHLMRIGKIHRCDLPYRVVGGSPPEITVVDMKREQGVISKLLQQKIREASEKGRQSILFLNRRGFTYLFHCKTCGFQMSCRRCSVSLTYHKSRNKMLCHYCGYSAAPLSLCPDCGSLDVGYTGFGTQMIEEEIGNIFPDLSVRRVDADSVRRKGSLKTILDDFHDGKIDILMGTQMVAKGLNFPGVKLVGVVLADTALHLPDFRSQERTFSIITQVAGRAGRFMPDGEVIVQTFRPDNEAVQLAATGDLSSFYERELEIRKQLAFPPFTRLIRLVLRGKKQEDAEESAGKIAGDLRNRADSEVEILGPAECALARVAGNYRFHVLIRTTRFGHAHHQLASYLTDYRNSKGVHLEVDIDPTSLL